MQLAPTLKWVTLLLTLSSFIDHFQNLNNNDLNVNTQRPEINPISQADVPTEFEIRKAVKKLENGKAAGVDQILNEFIKHSLEDMLKLICSYFNLILDTGIDSYSWTLGLIVPIFKNKGDINNPDNYRGIIPAKLYR